MYELSDYRVGDWIENGLMKRIRDNVILTRISVSKAAVVVAIGFAGGIATNLNPIGSAETVSTVAVAELHARLSDAPVMARLRELGSRTEHQAANFDNADISDIDADLLALAEEAIAKIDSRSGRA